MSVAHSAARYPPSMKRKSREAAEQAAPANAVPGPAPGTGVVPLEGEGAEGDSGGAFQYATGVGSSERHMYQVATLRQGAQASATSRASLRLTGSPEK